MYEIIANPADYEIKALIEGMGYKKMAFPDEKRRKWAQEVGNFAVKMEGLAEKAKELAKLLKSEEEIIATPASLQTFKKQRFKINDALETALTRAHKVETEFIKREDRDEF